MSFLPPSFAPAPAVADNGDELSAGAKWLALHDAAGVVARLAGIDDQPRTSAIGNFPLAIRGAAPWRQQTAERGIDDLAAIMQPGIAALLAVNARGADARTPALALWREFDAARAALLVLAPPAAG